MRYAVSESSFLDYAQRELNSQNRKQISKEIRKNCPEGDPMTTNITVMLGSILAMAVFSAMLYGGTKGRGR
jgi:hypothetical protein